MLGFFIIGGVTPKGLRGALGKGGGGTSGYEFDLALPNSGKVIVNFDCFDIGVP